jgi:hypothetical protein
MSNRSALQGFLIIQKRLIRILDILTDLFFPKNPFLLAGCSVPSVVYRVNSKDTPDNIYCFSDDQPQNSESNGNSTNESGSDDVEMADDQPQNSESNGNSTNESESDDVEMADVEEVDNHNAPEEIMNDLDKVDAAKNKDREALDYLKKEYSHFFDRNTEEEGLKQLEEYLEEEFEPEHQKSELESYAEDEDSRAKHLETSAESLRKSAASLSDDDEEKSRLNRLADSYSEEAEKCRQRAEEL